MKNNASQCIAVNRKGIRCKRNALPKSQLCWLHTPWFVVTLSILIIIILGCISFLAYQKGYLTPLTNLLKPSNDAALLQLVQKGDEALDKGQYTEAMDFYNQALAIAREKADRSGEGNILNDIGMVYQEQDQYDQALDYYNQALAIKREVKDRAGEGEVIKNMGSIYQAQSLDDQAINSYNKSLAIAREVADRAGEANALEKLGSIYKFRAENDKALIYYKKALAIAKEIGNKDLEQAISDEINSISK